MEVVAAPMWTNMFQPGWAWFPALESKTLYKAHVGYLLMFTCFQVPSQTLEASAVAFAPFAPAGWVYDNVQRYILCQLWPIWVSTWREGWVSVGTGDVLTCMYAADLGQSLPFNQVYLSIPILCDYIFPKWFVIESYESMNIWYKWNVKVLLCQLWVFGLF